MQVQPIALTVIRTLSGLSQAELSRRSGISQGHISGLEKGDKKASPDSLRRLAEAMGVPLAALLTDPTCAQIADAQAKVSQRVPAAGGLRRPNPEAVA